MKSYFSVKFEFLINAYPPINILSNSKVNNNVHTRESNQSWLLRNWNSVPQNPSSVSGRVQTLWQANVTHKTINKRGRLFPPTGSKLLYPVAFADVPTETFLCILLIPANKLGRCLFQHCCVLQVIIRMKQFRVCFREKFSVKRLLTFK